MASAAATSPSPDKAAPQPPLAVFLDSSLGTHLAVLVAGDATIRDLKSQVAIEHAASFPDLGAIDVKALKVRHKGALYHLSDSMRITSAFEGIKGARFLHVEAVATMPEMTNRAGCVRGAVVEDGRLLERESSRLRVCVQHCAGELPAAEEGEIGDTAASEGNRSEKQATQGDVDNVPSSSTDASKAVPCTVRPSSTSQLDEGMEQATSVNEAQPNANPVSDQGKIDHVMEECRNSTPGASDDPAFAVVGDNEKSRKESDISEVEKEGHGRKDEILDADGGPDAGASDVAHKKEKSRKSKEVLEETNAMNDLSLEKQKHKKAEKVGSFDMPAADLTREKVSEHKEDVAKSDRVPKETSAQGELRNESSIQKEVSRGIPQEESALLGNPNVDGQKKKRKRRQSEASKEVGPTQEVTKPSSRAGMDDNSLRNTDSVTSSAKQVSSGIPEVVTINSHNEHSKGSDAVIKIVANEVSNRLSSEEILNKEMAADTLKEPTHLSSEVPSDENVLALNRNSSDVANLAEALPPKYPTEIDPEAPISSRGCKKSKSTPSVAPSSKLGSAVSLEDVTKENARAELKESNASGASNKSSDRTHVSKVDLSVPTYDSMKDTKHQRKRKSGKYLRSDSGGVVGSLGEQGHQVTKDNTNEEVGNFDRSHGKGIGGVDATKAAVVQGDSMVPVPASPDGKLHQKKKKFSRTERLNPDSTVQGMVHSSSEQRNQNSEDNCRERVDVFSRSHENKTEEVDNNKAAVVHGDGAVVGSANPDGKLQKREKSSTTELQTQGSAPQDGTQTRDKDVGEEQSKVRQEIDQILAEIETNVSSLSYGRKLGDGEMPFDTSNTSHLTNSPGNQAAHENLAKMHMDTAGDSGEKSTTGMHSDGDTGKLSHDSCLDPAKSLSDLSDKHAFSHDLTEKMTQEKRKKLFVNNHGTSVTGPPATGSLENSADAEANAYSISEKVVGSSISAEKVQGKEGETLKQNKGKNKSRRKSDKRLPGPDADLVNSKSGQKSSHQKPREPLVNNYGIDGKEAYEMRNPKSSSDGADPNDGPIVHNLESDKINFVDYFGPRKVDGSSVPAENVMSMEGETVKPVKEKKKSKRKSDTHVRHSSAELVNPAAGQEKPHQKLQDTVAGNDPLPDSMALKGRRKHKSTKEHKERSLEGNSEPHQEPQDKTYDDSALEKKLQERSRSIVDHQPVLSTEKHGTHTSKVKEMKSKSRSKPNHHQNRETENTLAENFSVNGSAPKGSDGARTDPSQKRMVYYMAASSDSTEDTPSHANRYRLAVRKVPRRNLEKVLKNSKKENKKSTTGTIFNDAMSESSEDRINTNNKKPEIGAASDGSFTSADSAGALDDIKSQRTGISSAGFDGKDKALDGDGITMSQSSGKLHISSILRSSSSYKKAKLTASQSQAEDSESQPVDIVFETQQDSP